MDEGAGKKGGNVYYLSDSSHKFVVDFVGAITLMKDSTGRVIKFDEDTGTVEVLMTGLAFPNGIEFTDDKTAVLVNELTARKTWKYFVRGPKKGSYEVLCPNLPGFPDNIRRSARKDKETYWIAFYDAVNPERPNPMTHALVKYPQITQVGLKALFNLGKVVMDVGEVFKFQPLIDLGFMIKTQLFHQKIDPFATGLAIEIDSRCDIVGSLQGKAVPLLSEVREVHESGRTVLYLGSYFNDFLGKITKD